MGASTPAAISSELHRFGLQRDRFRAALCRSAGITDTELAAAEHLEEAGPLTQRELGQRLSLTSGGITVLIDRLQRRGWVTRTSHPTDRRAVLLALTKDAREAAPPELARYHLALAQAARAVAAEHRDAVAAFLAAATALAENAAVELLPATSHPLQPRHQGS